MACSIRGFLLAALLLNIFNHGALRVDASSGSNSYNQYAATNPSVQSNDSPLPSTPIDPVVQQAIQKCRDKLSQDPDFPKAQHMLAILLESLPPTTQIGDDGTSIYEQIASLSLRAGRRQKKDHLHALEDTKRVDAYLRAARACQRIGQETLAIECQRQALLLVAEGNLNTDSQHNNDEDGTTNQQDMMEELLRNVTPTFVRHVSSQHRKNENHPTMAELNGSSSQSSNNVFAKQFFDLSDTVVHHFPKSVVAHQFQGAIARALGHKDKAYQAYHIAATMIPPEQPDPISTSSSSPSSSLLIELLETHVQSNILASSAAKEAGRDISTQLKYLASAQSLLDEYHAPSYTNGDNSKVEQYLRAEVLNAIGIAQKAVGHTSEAIAAFQSALTAKPGDGHALAQLASLGAVPSMDNIKTLDADYVQGLFDGYSARFEDELVNDLEYQGHQWVADQVSTALSTMQDTTTIVDIGCGTGLVGELVQKNCQESNRNQKQQGKSPALFILGVDLSERMVALAASRVYQDLPTYESVDQGDGVEFLLSRPKASVNAIVAADVFIYIGDLEPVLEAGAAVLAPAGVFVFSVELAEEADNDKKGMLLLKSGRFGHSQAYVEKVAKKAGLKVTIWDEGALRKQGGATVRGAVVVLKKR